MKNVLRSLCLLFVLFFSSEIKAQFKSAIVGIDGLTCSACSFATEKSIRTLNFVDSVAMELDKNIATVYFKKGSRVSIQLLARKVFDAGFAVRSMDATFDFKDLSISDGSCFEFENDTYHFIKIDSEKKLNGISSVRFIGEKFMSKKEFRSWKLLAGGSCKSGPAASMGTQYYITLR